VIAAGFRGHDKLQGYINFRFLTSACYYSKFISFFEKDFFTAEGAEGAEEKREEERREKVRFSYY
jgi:hypothetical protein